MEILPPELVLLIKKFLPSPHENRTCPSRPIFFNHTGSWCAHCGGSTPHPFYCPPHLTQIKHGKFPAFLKKCPICSTLMFLRDAFCVNCGEWLPQRLTDRKKTDT